MYFLCFFTLLSDLHGKKHHRNEHKIDSTGGYKQFCGFSIISTCAELDELQYLERFIRKSEIMRKIISPLPYTSYHMTTYGIYTNSKKTIKFVQDWLDKDRTRTVDHAKCIPADDVYPILNSAQTVWDNTESGQFTVSSECLQLGRTGINFVVKMDDANLEKKFDHARSQCDEEIFHKTTKHVPLHIGLGYVYAEIDTLSSKEKSQFKKEMIELEQILPKKVKLNPPKVSSFSTMKEYVPIIR